MRLRGAHRHWCRSSKGELHSAPQAWRECEHACSWCVPPLGLWSLFDGIRVREMTGSGKRGKLALLFMVRHLPCTHRQSAPSCASACCDRHVANAKWQIKEGPNNPGVWRRWLHAASTDFSVWVHAKSTKDVHDPLFKDNLIGSVPTEWGTVSLVEAHLALLRAALEDQENRWTPTQ